MKNKASQKGFTLLEILVSVTMIALIVSIVFAGYLAIIKTTERGNTKLSSLKESRKLLTCLAGQLRCSYTDLEKVNKHRQNTNSQQRKPEENGVINYFTTETTEQDILNFVTTNGTFSRHREIPGLWIMSYRLNENEGILYANRKRFIAGTKFRPEDKGWLPVAKNVNYLRLQFFDGERWVDSWDYMQKEKLPDSIRIELGFRGEDNQNYAYKTAVNTGCYQTVHEADFLKRVTEDNEDI